jgi:choline dehydrogenase-like flavoprotein
VRRLEEREGKVEVTCDTAGGGREKVVLDRVFLAAGAIGSTRIILESKRLFNRRVTMKSTQGFILPMLRMSGAPISWPNTNTLAAAFLEFKLPEVSDHWVHAQINPANELVMARLDFRPNGGRWRDRILKPAFKRLLVALCSFHSDHAGTHVLTLRSASDAAPSPLVIETPSSDTFHQTARRGARRLCRLVARAGVLPLLPFIQGTYDKPWGWHFGGTLPMSSRPKGDLDSDLLGRPLGWTRVHVVDSSVFPSIPGTTVALLAMANARRIADTAPLD